MSISKLKVFDIKSGEVLDKKGLKMVFLVIVIREVMEGYKDFEVKRSQGGIAKNVRFNYFEATKKGLSKVSRKGADKRDSKKVEDIKAELLVEIDEAINLMTGMGSKLTCTSELIEFWVFFTAIAKNSIDKVTLLEDKEIQSRLSVVGGRDYYSKVQINYNNNVWVYDVFNKNTSSIQKKISVDGVQNPSLSHDALMISTMLSMVAVMSQKDEVDKRFVAEYSENKSFVKKAKAITSILGGEWQDYIIFVGSMSENISHMDNHNSSLGEQAGEDNKTTKDKVIKAIANKDLRATEQEINEVIKMFLDKPIYH